jgi:hypothetical protein
VDSYTMLTCVEGVIDHVVDCAEDRGALNLQYDLEMACYWMDEIRDA